MFLEKIEMIFMEYSRLRGVALDLVSALGYEHPETYESSVGNRRIGNER